MDLLLSGGFFGRDMGGLFVFGVEASTNMAWAMDFCG